MSVTFDFLFYPKKPKGYNLGPVKLYLRITIDSRRSETSTSRFVLPENWDRTSQRLKGKGEDIRQFNAYLDALQNKLYNCHRELLLSGENISAENLINAFTGKEENQYKLVEIFREHNRNIEKLIGKEYSKTTLTKYNTTINHLERFLKWKYKISDISLKQLRYEFLSDFEFYLKSEKNIDHNTTAKYIKNTKKVVNECLAKGWLKANPFLNFKIKTRIVDRVFLSEEELNLIASKDLKIKRIDQVRDLFVFSCYTGLSYIDMVNLTPNQMVTGIDGQKWIFTSRQKTNSSSHIPLLPPAMQVIEKYRDHPKAINSEKLLPMLSNQKMNAYLKEIADLCSINKELTFHIARHTFATTVTLTNGVPIESVSKMLGHKKIQTTQHYAKILDLKVSADMGILFDKFKQQDKKLKAAKPAKSAH